VIHETLESRRSLEQLTLGGHTRTAWSDLRAEAGEEGPIWQSVHLTGSAGGFESLRCEIRLYKTAKRIELVYQGRKRNVTDPEAVYVAFPFALPGGRLAFEAQGAEIVPGEGQLPGTASDWNTIQSYAAVESDGARIVLVSEEAPLMQFGAINTGRYAYTGRPASNQIYSFVLNNYWVTNFRAGQEGDLRWTYVITSSPREGDHPALFAWGVRIPMIARVRAGRPGASGAPLELPALGCEGENILLVRAAPARDGAGILVHLREIGGRATGTDGASNDQPIAPGLKAQRVNALGETMAAPAGIRLEPFATRFFRLSAP
jgi:alpha-mannosidase